MAARSTKLAFSHALSLLPITIPPTIQIPKIPNSHSAKQALSQLLSALPEDLQQQIFGSLAQCKQCGFSGPIAVISSKNTCFCGANLSIVLPPMIQGIVYDNQEVKTHNLVSFVCFNGDEYRAVLCQEGGFRIEKNDQFLIAKPGEIEEFLSGKSDKIGLGKVILGLYINTIRENNRTVEFQKIQPAPRKHFEKSNVNITEPSNTINYTSPDLEKQIDNQLRDLPKDFEIDIFSQNLCCFQYVKAPSNHKRYCECMGCGCSITSHYSIYALICFSLMGLIFLLNLILFLVVMFARLPDSEVFIADNVIVRNNILVGQNVQKGEFGTFVSQQVQLNNTADIYVQNVDMQLGQVRVLNSSTPFMINGIGSDQITVNSVSANSVIVNNQTVFNGNSVVVNNLMEVSNNTNLNFGSEPTYSGKITLNKASINDLTLDTLQFSQFFNQSGTFINQLQVVNLNTVNGTIQTLNTNTLTADKITVQTLNVTENMVLSDLQAGNLTVLNSILIENSKVNLPQKLAFRGNGIVNGDLNLNGQIKLNGTSTISVLNTDNSIIRNVTIQNLETQLINATGKTLNVSNLNSQIVKLNSTQGSLTVSQNKLFTTNNDMLSMNATKINCTDFTAQQNLDVKTVTTKRVN